MEKQQQQLQTVIVLVVVVVVVFTGSACLARWLAAHTSNSLREAAAVAVVKFINLRWRITPTGWPRSARGFLYPLLIRHVGRGSSSYVARYRFSQSWRVGVFFYHLLFFCLSCDSEWRLRRLEAKLKALQESLIEKVKEFQLTVDICYFYFDNAAVLLSFSLPHWSKYFVCWVMCAIGWQVSKPLSRPRHLNIPLRSSRSRSRHCRSVLAESS